MTVFLDTNVLAYQYDDARPEKQARAREVFLAQAADAVISTQVMIELHAVLTRKLGRSGETASRVLDALDLEVVPADAALVRRAATTAAAHQLSIFDALVLEAAVAGGCDELWTEDLADGSTLRGVRIVDPFR
ncbi:PIN domain-containing protein [Nocardioides sp. BYT-33-1]|uniref:PIN domain-containing protein n=1 Tax=Nocardioides sp. BYT-33-1 TaxID=3416952 RepID=UPI003F534A0F